MAKFNDFSSTFTFIPIDSWPLLTSNIIGGSYPYVNIEPITVTPVTDVAELDWGLDTIKKDFSWTVISSELDITCTNCNKSAVYRTPHLFCIKCWAGWFAQATAVNKGLNKQQMCDLYQKTLMRLMKAT